MMRWTWKPIPIIPALISSLHADFCPPPLPLSRFCEGVKFVAYLNISIRMSDPHGRTFPCEHAFLKLQEPEVMAPDEPDPPPEKSVEWMSYWLYRTPDLRFIPDPRLVQYLAEYSRCNKSLPISWKSMEEFMEINFPTRYWKEDDVRYKQKVSMEQVTRDDLKAMNNRLDEQLLHRQGQLNARYCPIRFGLHMELFDELSRQVALNDPARAFMLERVRGELKETLDAYRKVVEVSLVENGKLVTVEYVDPEVVMLEAKMSEVEKDLDAVTVEFEAAMSDMQELELKFELMDRLTRDVHEPEVAFTKRLGEALERQLWHFENPPKFETGDEEDKNK